MEVLPDPTSQLEVLGNLYSPCLWETGMGSIVLRSRIEIETTKSGRAYCYH